MFLEFKKLDLVPQSFKIEGLFNNVLNIIFKVN